MGSALCLRPCDARLGRAEAAELCAMVAAAGPQGFAQRSHFPAPGVEEDQALGMEARRGQTPLLANPHGLVH